MSRLRPNSNCACVEVPNLIIALAKSSPNLEQPLARLLANPTMLCVLLLLLIFKTKL